MKKFFSSFLFVLLSNLVIAQSEPSTYFNIFVPPNNEPVLRNVSLIVTAINDSTTFSILDDNMDGDSDDNVTGMLMAGQSYILYIKDNGINDDAQYASGGVLTRDGDHFIINSDQLIYASMSTDSDWQHDFVPSVNKKSIGQKFFVYASKISSSPRDLNVFAYEENTTFSIFKISASPTIQTGYTNINLATKTLVVQKTIHPGQDIIHFSIEGRNVMETGATYLIESNKDVSVQYGALWGNSKDGGAYVPSSNGSASGELFYFAVPYQSIGQQEIRIASWDSANDVQLSRYESGTWVNMKNWTLNELDPADWVGAQNGNVSYQKVFRVTCTPGKRVSVKEANWMETGAHTTSDMATMVSSESGSSAGKVFLAYLLPPSKENNVKNPFTGLFFTEFTSHFYLFAGTENTTVTVKDAKTNGMVINKTYTIAAGKYADASFNIAEWKSIYNGTGTPSGPERPYLKIESTKNISVLSTNFNDNWMTHFGSSLPQKFTQTSSVSSDIVIPGDEVTFNSVLEISSGASITDPTFEVKVASGLIPIESKIIINDVVVGTGNIETTNLGSVITFNSLPTISSSDSVSIETKVLVTPIYNDGATIPNQVVLSVESIVSGNVDGEFQQSYSTKGVQNNAANTSNLIYSACQLTTIASGTNDSWNPAWVDYDNDGNDDLFVATKDELAKNELYKNNGDGTFTKILNQTLVNEKANTVASVWADINNDGKKDVLLVNATLHNTKLFINNGAGDFTEIENSGIDPQPQYFHGAAFADFDNDGFVDLIITNFFETRFHQLYKNNGNNTFTAITSSPVTLESERSMAPILADYNNDGLVDIFIPNGSNRQNSLFKNLGNFQFEKILDTALQLDSKSSVGAAWGDFNNDGFLDLVVANASGQNNDLYLNNGNGTFQKMGSSIISTQGGDSHGVATLDVNNDGWLDVYITNDTGPSFLYINDAQGGFYRKLDELVSGTISNAFGVAVGDYNKDGQLDMAVSTHTTGTNKMYCNNGNENKWIGFQLQGVYSNKQAIGARVAIKSNGIWQQTQNLPITGFGSQRMGNLHFGLGDATSVDSVIVYWPSGVKQIVTSFSLNQYNMILEEANKLVNGTVFHDLNENGIKDAGEPQLSNIQLKINQGELNLSSDDSGSFEFRTNNTDLTFGLNQQNWSISPLYTDYQFAAGQNVLNIDIPLNDVLLGYDLNISLATTAWRRGFTNNTSILVSNLGTQTAENASVNLVFPDEAYLVSSDLNYTSPAAKTFVWNIGSIQPGEIKTIQIVDSIGLEAVTGQLKLIQASVDANGIDLDSTNNELTEEVEIVGPIDPNDMIVSPKGYGQEGFIYKDQSLTYTIRFENVGTYAASYVFLENELSEVFDLSTFEIISSSHDYTYTLSEKGKLEVAYRLINLPAAINDSLGSLGYFKYKIKPKNTLTGGTKIINNANIIFDFEDPIVTNTVMNTIKFDGSQESKSLMIYPNPASDMVNMLIDEEFYKVTEPLVIVNWNIQDIKGSVLYEGTGNFQAMVKTNVSQLPQGIYMINAYDQFGQGYVGKMIKD